MEVILQDILKPSGNAESICKTSDFFLQEVSRSLDFSSYLTDGCGLREFAPWAPWGCRAMSASRKVLSISGCSSSRDQCAITA